MIIVSDGLNMGHKAVTAAEELGSTTNMVRIVSQFGEEVRGRDGYIVEAAIPATVLGEAPAPGYPKLHLYPCLTNLPLQCCPLTT